MYSGSLAAVVIVPTILFLVVVMPLWLTLHYRSKRQAASQLNEDERRELEILADKAESFAERIEVLEAILDDQVPDWRCETHAKMREEREFE